VSEKRRPAKLELCALGAVLLTLVAAPAPGDVGGCGQAPQELDARVFYATKSNVDCQRCQECELSSRACAGACARTAPIPKAFPEHCIPLVHDGEVCLRALYNASCDEYARYMDDAAPGRPTECDFCPQR
jgi:hypothetical protein